MTSTPTLVTRIRDELADRRERRDAASRLRRELATYTTRTQIDDMLATIGDADTEIAEEMRSILLNNQTAHGRRWPYAS